MIYGSLHDSKIENLSIKYKKLDTSQSLSIDYFSEFNLPDLKSLSFRKNPITDKIIPRIKNLQELIVDELDDIENFYAVIDIIKSNRLLQSFKMFYSYQVMS